jgi:hypothetical protein
MVDAIPVSEADWKYAAKIKANNDVFNYLSRVFIMKESMPAVKVHMVEFFVKP